MRKIELTQGQVALVDDDMYGELNQHKWHASKIGNIFYARRVSPMVNGKRHQIHMHREIIGGPPEGYETDHRDGSGLNNQRENLRHVTNRQNGQNQQNVEATSIYPGVHWDKSRNKWMAMIKTNKKRKNLGRFIDEKEAFFAYKGAVEALGEKVIDENIYVNL